MITFAGFSKRSSGIIRGQQISEIIPHSDFVDIDFPVDPKNEIVIHVRKYNEDFSRHCKSNNLIVGYDIADNPVTDYLYGRVKEDDFSRYTNKLCDFYIVNNDIYKEKLSKVTDKKIYVIPHHNCNFSKTINELKERPVNLGYVGVPEYTLNEKSLQDFCNKQNLTFTSYNPQNHHELDSTFKKIDLGIIFFEKNSINVGVYERTLKYKPNTKLTNFQSYGIPTICLPYESYKQFGENKCVFVEDFDDLKQRIIDLCNDFEEYSSLSKESIKVGEKYHISKIKDYYGQIMKDFL